MAENNAEKQVKYRIPISKILEEDGLEVLGGNDNGGVDVIDKESEEVFEVNDLETYAKEYLKFNDKDSFIQVEKGAAELRLNDQDTPLNNTLLSAVERGKLATGNVKGNLSFLKNKYDEATLNSEKEIVYRKGASWYKLDPSYVGDGDAWDMVEELGNDVVEFSAGNALQMAGGTAAAITGAFTAGPVGAVFGEGAGAMAGELARQSLGRYFGTYEATTEEALMDQGLEFMLSAGSVGVGRMVKDTADVVVNRPTIQAVIKGVKNLGNVASRESKNILQGIMDLTSGSTPPVSSFLINESDKAAKHIGKLASKSYRSFDDLEKEVVTKNRGKLVKLFKDYDNGIAKEFQKRETDFLNSKGVEDFSMDFNKVKKTLLEGGTFDNGAEVAGLANETLISDMLTLNKKTGSYELVPKSEIKNIVSATNLDLFSVDAMYKSIDKFLTGINRVSTEKVTGKAGAKLALNLKRSMDDLLYNGGGKVNPLKTTLKGYSVGIRQDAATSLQKTTAGDLYKEMNDLFIDNVDNLFEAKRITGSKNVSKAAEGFINNILKGRGASPVLTSETLDKAGRFGNQRLRDDILGSNTALHFMKWTPTVNWNIAGVARMGTVAGAAIGSEDTSTTLAVGALMSPRLMGKAARGLVKSGALWSRSSSRMSEYAGRALSPMFSMTDALSKMTRTQKDNLINNPVLLRGFVQPLRDAIEGDNIQQGQ